MILGLLNSLQITVQQIVNERPLASGKIAQVHKGSLPKIDKDNKEKKDEPFVLIKPVDGVFTGNDSTLGVLLIIGSKSDDDDAWQEPILLCESIVADLIGINIIDNMYEITDDVKWDFYESDTQPKWFAGVQIWFNVPGPFNSYGLNEIGGK